MRLTSADGSKKKQMLLLINLKFFNSQRAHKHDVKSVFIPCERGVKKKMVNV